MNHRLLFIASLVILIAVFAVAAAARPASASASSVVKCNGHTFGMIDESSFPGIDKLRAHNLPRRTDGYAPRCLVAESVAGMVQTKWGNGVGFPQRVRVMGARWYAGYWRVRYRQVTVHSPEGGDWTYGAVTATRIGHPRQHVTFRGYS